MSDTVADIEETQVISIPWRPGMCTTPDCGHPVPGEVKFCDPCEILFGSYDRLIAQSQVNEWTPPAPPKPSTKRKRTPKAEPKVEAKQEAQSETS